MQSIVFPQRQRYDYEQESTNSFLGADARTTRQEGNVSMGHLEPSGRSCICYFWFNIQKSGHELSSCLGDAWPLSAHSMSKWLKRHLQRVMTRENSNFLFSKFTKFTEYSIYRILNLDYAESQQAHSTQSFILYLLVLRVTQWLRPNVSTGKGHFLQLTLQSEDIGKSSRKQGEISPLLMSSRKVEKCRGGHRGEIAIKERFA